MSSRALSLRGALAWIVVVWCTPSGLAADREIIQLQRDVALVGDQVKNLQTAINTLQTTVNEKLGTVGALVQQSVDLCNQIHTENAVAAKSLGDQLSQKIVAPIASVNVKLDQLATQASATQENLTDISSRLGKLEQRLVDLENAVKVLQTPPAPAPGAQDPNAPPPGITAHGLFQDATRDQVSGNSDLALQEYRDYLKYFGATETAATAEFHIGEILLNQDDLDGAIQTFDIVANVYPRSSKAPDALYLKAQALKKQGKRTSAMTVLNQLIRQYPDSDAAANAKSELPPGKRPVQK